eukprot:7834379-Pyramimonas_sp.AAC.1
MIKGRSDPDLRTPQSGVKSNSTQGRRKSGWGRRGGFYNLRSDLLTLRAFQALESVPKTVSDQLSTFMRVGRPNSRHRLVQSTQ